MMKNKDDLPGVFIAVNLYFGLDSWIVKFVAMMKNAKIKCDEIYVESTVVRWRNFGTTNRR